MVPVIVDVSTSYSVLDSIHTTDEVQLGRSDLRRCLVHHLWSHGLTL